MFSLWCVLSALSGLGLRCGGVEGFLGMRFVRLGVVHDLSEVCWVYCGVPMCMVLFFYVLCATSYFGILYGCI